MNKEELKDFFLGPLIFIGIKLILGIVALIVVSIIIGGVLGILFLSSMYSWWYILLLIPFVYIILLSMEILRIFT